GQQVLRSLGDRDGGEQAGHRGTLNVKRKKTESKSRAVAQSARIPVRSASIIRSSARPSQRDREVFVKAANSTAWGTYRRYREVARSSRGNAGPATGWRSAHAGMTATADANALEKIKSLREPSLSWTEPARSCRCLFLTDTRRIDMIDRREF